MLRCITNRMKLTASCYQSRGLLQSHKQYTRSFFTSRPLYNIQQQQKQEIVKKSSKGEITRLFKLAKPEAKNLTGKKERYTYISIYTCIEEYY